MAWLRAGQLSRSHGAAPDLTGETKILTDKVGKRVIWPLLHQTDQNELSHVIHVRSQVSHVTKTPHPQWRQQEVYLFVSTLLLNSVKLKGISSRFFCKNIRRQMIHQHHYRLRNTTNILLNTRSLPILFFLFLLVVLLAINKCNRALSSVISVCQHCECGFWTPFVCLSAPLYEASLLEALRRAETRT